MRDAFKFMWRYKHFCNNSKKKKPDGKGYNPLFKIGYALDEIGKRLRRAWKAGQGVTMDENVIKYIQNYDFVLCH